MGLLRERRTHKGRAIGSPQHKSSASRRPSTKRGATTRRAVMPEEDDLLTEPKSEELEAAVEGDRYAVHGSLSTTKPGCGNSTDGILYQAEGRQPSKGGVGWTRGSDVASPS